MNLKKGFSRIIAAATACYIILAVGGGCFAARSALLAYDAALKTYTIRISGTNQIVTVRARDDAEVNARMKALCRGASCPKLPASIPTSRGPQIITATQAFFIAVAWWVVGYGALWIVYIAIAWIINGFRDTPLKS